MDRAKAAALDQETVLVLDREAAQGLVQEPAEAQVAARIVPALASCRPA